MQWMSFGRSRAGRGCLAVAMFLAAGGEQSLFAGVVEWTGAGGGWNNPANWNPGVPDGASDVQINSAAVLDLGGSASIQSLLLGTSGNLTIQALSTLTVGPSPAPADLVLDNQGRIDVTGGTLNVDLSSGAASSASGSVWVSQGGTLGLAGTGQYEAGNTSIGSLASAGTLQVTGQVTVNSGEITLGSSGSSIGGAGDLTLEYYATLSGEGTVQTGSLTNYGFINASQNSLVISGATNFTNWDGASSTLSEGGYSATDTLRVSAIGGGSIRSLEAADVSVGGSGLVTGDGITNALAGLTQLSNSGLRLIGTTAPMTITPDNGGQGTGTLQLNAVNTGFGQLGLAAASLTVAGNLNHEAQDQGFGTIWLAEGSALTVQGNFTQDALDAGEVGTLVSSSTLHVTGDTTQTGAGLVLVGGLGAPKDALQDAPGSTGTFDGAFNNNDAEDNYGSLLSIDGSTVSTGAFQNDYYSEVELFGGGYLTTGAFNNNGTVTLCGCALNELTVATGDFSNDRGLVIIGTDNVLTVTNGIYVQPAEAFNEAWTEVQGTLRANVVVNGGSLEGLGTIDGNLENNAVVLPGDVGTMTITGNYIQGMQGLLLLELAGLDSTEFGSLSIGSDVTLDGMLEVFLRENYIPVANESFRILSWVGTLTGNFTSWNLPTLDGLTFSVVVGNNELILQVSEAAAVPEPSTWLLCFTAMLVLGLAIRRKSLTRVVAKKGR